MWTYVNTAVESIETMAAAAGFVDLSADTGIAVQNARGEILAASAEAQIILGLTMDQLQERTSYDPRWAAVDELGQPLPGCRHPAMRALSTGIAVRDSIVGVHRPGSDAPGHHVWLDVTAVPIQDHSSTCAVVTAFRPITGERLTALQLRDSERLYRMIAEHSSDMVTWQLLADFTYLWVSPASRAVLGIDSEELIGMRGADLVHPEDRGALEQWRRTAIDDGWVPTQTLRMRRPDGSYQWIETTAHVLDVGDGTPAQLITTHRNVTDRVLAERARDAAVKMFELAMAHATIGVALLLDGHVCRVNPALSAMLGRGRDELVGHSLSEFVAGHHELETYGRRAHRDADNAAFALSVPSAGVVANHETEREFRRPDGTAVWCITTVIALPDASGDVKALMVQLQDITSRKEAAAQLEKAARTDPLTGLPNRAALEDRLERALSCARHSGTLVGVLFIDLDDFKQINDTLGHQAGDVLLREVGMRLSSAVRRTDTVVRLGGDEFVIARGDLTDVGELDHLVDRIRKVLAPPFLINGQRLIIAASIGTSAGDTIPARALLHRADQHMYQTKRSVQSKTHNSTQTTA